MELVGVASLYCLLTQGKQHLINQPSNIGTASKGSDVKSKLTNAILHGEGSARERLRMRKAQAQPQAQGTCTLYLICTV